LHRNWKIARYKKIEEEIINLANYRSQLKGKKIIVTAGGTKEPIDEVRVITNNSSGKMGIAIAEELAKRGAEVTLIRGRTDIEPLSFIEDVKIISSKDMFNEIKKRIIKTDILIHAAAVSDFTVEKMKGKIKSDKSINLKLIPNIKIISQIKKLNKDVFLIGFKAEHGLSKKQLIDSARESLQKNNADLVVANDISKFNFGSDRNEITMISKKGIENYPAADKKIIARYIINRW
jgi:phosphopantothenoylcysteine decarboxylase/phosphopantothenate--cysteine ligase